jgi:tetratricopeptide (TPR) repeat protein
MDTPFERKQEIENIRVQMDDMVYSGDEVVAYYDEILSGLMAQPPSVKNKAQLVNMVKILMKKRENKRASGVVHRISSRYPSDSTVLKLQIEILINLKEYSNALKIVEEETKENYYDISLIMAKAKIYSQMNNHKSEENAYHEILNLPFGDFMTSRAKISAVRHLAELYLKQGHLEEAMNRIEDVIRKAPDESSWAMYFTILMRLGNVEMSSKANEGFARFRRALSYFTRGSEYESENKLNLALASYRKGLDIYPQEPIVSLKVGNILMYRKGLYSRAEEYFKKAVELDPDNASYRSNLVLCLRNQGKYNEAFEHAKVAESLDPLSNISHLRGLAQKVSKIDEFVEIIKDAIDKDVKGGLPGLRYELGLHYESRGDQELADSWYNKALEIYINKVKQYPESWESYIELGNCLKRLRMYREAESSFKAAEGIKGAQKDEIYENLVEIYRISHQPNKSTSYIKKMIVENPGKLVNYIDLGINYLSVLASFMRKKD